MTESSKLDLINPIYAIFNGVLRWIGIVLLCVVVAMVVEVLGTKLIFDNVDGSRLQQRTQHEQEMYWEHTENTTLWVSPTTLSQTINQHLQQLFLAISNRLHVPANEESTAGNKLPIISTLNQLRQWFEEQLILVGEVVQACTFRVCAFVSCILHLLPFMLVAVVDGLGRREIRRLSGGRESSWLYTIAHRSIRPLIMFFLVMFLIWPWSIDYPWITCSLGILLVTACHLSTSRLKKYL
ncbi:MAG: DUF4400 domain-containing protein [Gammaproteobacteria bacterium]|nr:DUF4400 domain-containing protein [Gammaproteobacteria bacterium]MDE0252774.1 DUF4400 domain-containing protein [Gammaproteobacteria bacterium]MDE0402218.1 DUF4400 domain-containing protein [Gammaproteobacteria bacterium]